MVGFVKILKFQVKTSKEKQEEYFYNLFTKKDTIEKADTLTIDTELSIKLPENANAFLATKFESQEIKKIIGPTNTKKGFG